MNSNSSNTYTTYIDTNNTYTYCIQDEVFQQVKLLMEQKKAAQKERKLYLVLNSTEKMYRNGP